jgi:hypothetical protein
MKIESQKRFRTFLIVLVYLIMVTMGIELGRHNDISPRTGWICSIALGLILTKICIIDSRIAGKPLSIFSYWLIFLFYSIAVPICIIRARGKFGLVIVIAHFIGLILGCTISYLITDFLVHGRLY